MEFRTFLRIFGLLRRYCWAVPLLVLLDAAASLSEGIGIGLMIPFFELLLRSREPQPDLSFFQPLHRFLEGFSDLQALMLIGAAMMGVLLCRAALLLAGAVLAGWLKGRVNDDLRRALFRQLLSVDYAYLVETHRSRLVNAFQTQLWRVIDALDVCSALLVSLCTIGIFTALLFFAAWQLAATILAFGLVVSGLIGRPMLRYVERLGDGTIAGGEAIARRVLHALDGMRVIRAFNQQDREERRFEGLSQRMRAMNFRMDLVASMIPPALELLFAPMFLATALVAWQAGIGVPTLLAFLVLFYRLQPHVKALDRGRAQLAGLAGAVNEVVALLDPLDAPATPTGGMAFERLCRDIEFREVGFDYRGASEPHVALSCASFKIRAGEVTAIVGASGAGKSTLVNLLYRLYEPTRGEILVDGRPLSSFDVVSWRAQLALAGQDAVLLDGTVAENIGYGRPEADGEAIVEAARLAAAHDFILQLPEGYDTEIGARGLRLSAGQRQRIGLARALLCRTPVLILDEATNALDGPTEEVVYRAIGARAEPLTVILISHRLGTLHSADHVVVLEEGRVVEQGAPAALMRRGGPFAKLCAARAEDVAEPLPLA